MSGSDIVTAMGRGWNRDPAGVTLGTHRTGVSAALWSHETDDVQEVDGGGAPLDQHVISFQCSTHHAEVFKDGRHCFTKSIRPGTVSWMEAGVNPRAVHRGPWRVLHLYLPPSLIGGLAAELGGADFVPVDPGCDHDDVVARIAREVLAEMRQDELLSRLRIDALGQDLAIQLLRRWSSLSRTAALNRTLARGGLAPWQVRRVSDYLEDRLADDVTLADLGELLGLSTFHVCRAFKQSTGLPPHRWRHQRRMERGRELLEGTNLSITEIAAAVGYDDPSRFASGFRKAFGLSPTDYRRERRS